MGKIGDTFTGRNGTRPSTRKLSLAPDAVPLRSEEKAVSMQEQLEQAAIIQPVFL